jgi:CRISPR-associated protein Cst1
MPNAFWNNNKNTNGLNICDTCSFLILHQHLAFTNLSDNTKIFINAPSFELMYELNKLIKELSKIDYKSTKELLAMSVIEYSLKINAILGNWLLMNIEIVAIDKKNNIEFINIPYNVLRIISNKKIAALLSDIGEFKILNIVLNEKYSELVEIAYRILRMSINYEGSNNSNDNIKEYLYLNKNNSSPENRRNAANKILRLFSIIKEQI